LFKLPCDTPEVLEAKREIPDDGLETTDNQCNSVHMLRMVDRFMSIQEADETKGFPGDKAFTIFTDPAGHKRRPNTKALHGNDALADVKNVVDRFCLNRRDSHEVGDARTFSIVWRNGHVFKRIIKGGPINNPKQERGFLVCPGEFIVDTVKGVGGRAAGAFIPIP